MAGADESGRSRRPPPTGSRGRRPAPPPRRPAPTGRPPRPARPGPHTPGGPVTPGPATPGAADESELIFMTHMPGVSVPPRPPEFEHDEDLQRLKAKLNGEEPPPEPKPKRGGLTLRLKQGAQRLSQAAGKGALERTLEAGRRSTGGMSQMFHRVETRAVAGVTVVRPETPGFLGAAVAALLRPLSPRSWPALVGGFAMLSAAGFLLELSPWIGLVLLAVAGVELAALRVRFVRDAAHGKDEVHWPDWSDLAAGLVSYPAALGVFAPALIAGLVALGPSAWDGQRAGSLPRRVAAVFSPSQEAPGPQDPDLPVSEQEQLRFGRNGLVVVEALLGSPPEGYDPRGPREVARDLGAAGLRRLRALVQLEGASGAGLAARAFLLLGLFGFPMALLAVAKLRSAYAALHAPMLLRSILRAPLAYLAVAALFLVQDAVLLGGLCLLEPWLIARLGGSLLAHLATVPVLAALAVLLPVLTGGVLGAFYVSHAPELAWE